MNSTFFIPHLVPFIQPNRRDCAQRYSPCPDLPAARKEQTAGKDVEFFEKCCGTQKGIFGEKALYPVRENHRL
jgi:hypothetical protein